MSEYKYDSTGSTFIYFFSIIITFSMSAYTYAFFLKKRKDYSEINKLAGNFCSCDACKVSIKKKKNRLMGGSSKIKSSSVVLLLGWLVVGYSLYLVYNASSLEYKVSFDPYEILGVSEGADLKAISAMRKKLVYEWHPDKAISRGIDPKIAEEKYAAINKAWATLKSPEAKRNWEEWGDPEGRQTLGSGIALPKWLVEEKNMNIVLGSYILLVIVLIPALMRRWWINLKKATSNYDLDGTSISELLRKIAGPMDPLEILDIIIELPDFKKVLLHGTPIHPEVEKLAAEIRKKMAAGNYKSWPVHCLNSDMDIIPYMVSIYLHSYFLRIESDDKGIKEDIEGTITMVSKVITIIQPIVFAKPVYRGIISIFQLNQWISQALYPYCSSAMQLPFFKEVVSHGNKSKMSQINEISNLYKLKSDQIVEKISYMAEEQKLLFMSTLKNLPIIEIISTEFEVFGEDEITADSRLTITIGIKINTVLNNWKNTEPARTEPLIPHCPYHPVKLSSSLFVIVYSPKYSSIIVVIETVFCLGVVTVSASFSTPKEPAKIPLVVDVLTDTYAGISASKNLLITTVAGKPHPKPVQKRNRASRKDASPSQDKNSKKKSSTSPENDLEDSSSSYSESSTVSSDFLS